MEIAHKKTFFPLICSSCVAGFLISLGSAAYCACGSAVIGAILFAAGLLTICYYGFHLYTGRVGYAQNLTDVKNLGIMLIGNLIGAFVGGLLVAWAATSFSDIVSSALLFIQIKNTLSSPAIFFRAILCGVSVFLAVDIYKEKRSILGILFFVPLFILCGWEHCVADMAYMAIAGLPMEPLRFGLVVLGNTIGALVFRALKGAANGTINA